MATVKTDESDWRIYDVCLAYDREIFTYRQRILGGWLYRVDTFVKDEENSEPPMSHQSICFVSLRDALAEDEYCARYPETGKD